MTKYKSKLGYVFYKSKSRKSRDKKRERDLHLQRKYGITQKEYDEILKSQGGVCAVCGKINVVRGKPANLAVDHNHETGQIRGLLCNRCNFNLNWIENKMNLARALFEYLDFWAKNAD